MPADPGANLGKRKMPTKEKDIGHVAPSFENPKFYNSLVVRPEYRISLELGNINDLFVHKQDSLEGKMERMQVAALFYFPMNHDKAKDAVKFGWKYYKETILQENDDKKAFEKLAERIQNFVVDGGELPPPAEDPAKPEAKNLKKIRFPGCYTYIDTDNTPFHPNHDGNYKIPMDTKNMWKAEEMCLHDNPILGAIPLIAKVEKLENKSGEWKPVKDATVYFQLADPYEFDKFPAFDDSVSPSQQINCPPLRKTDMHSDPDGNDETKGPHKHVKAAIEKEAKTDGDPQVDNCHKKYNGKRGLDVYKNIFEYKVDFRTHKKWTDGDPAEEKLRPGFHAEHDDADRKKQVKGPFYPEVKEPDEPDKHKYAVCAKTNENGYAGVIFKPSRVGGDRYRLQAYVGPDTIKGPGNDGKGINAVSVETGTLVVWRNYRVSKVVQMPYANMSADMLNQFKTGYIKTAHDYGYRNVINKSPSTDTLNYFKCYLGFSKTDNTDVGYSTVDLAETGDPNCAYEGFFKVISYAFGELELDPGADTPVVLDDADWKAAIKAAKDYLKSDNHNRFTADGITFTINIDNLFIPDNKVTAGTSVALLPLKSLKKYNEDLIETVTVKKIPTISVSKVNTIKPGTKSNPDKPGAIESAFDVWFDNRVLYPFIHKLAEQGFRPGLTMVQMPTISTWHACWTLGDYSIGVGYRTCIMLGGSDGYAYDKRQRYDPFDITEPTKNLKLKRNGTKKLYSDDGTFTAFDGLDLNSGYSALMAHEWGHCLFREHSPPSPENNVSPAKDKHDVITDDFCLMSYCPMEGDYCGKCNLSIRGWKDIKNLP